MTELSKEWFDETSLLLRDMKSRLDRVNEKIDDYQREKFVLKRDIKETEAILKEFGAEGK